MTYIHGTSAVVREPLNYDPVNFKRMRINAHSCQMMVKTDASGNTVFELFCDNVAVMAFRYKELRSWELRQKREAFSKLFRAEQMDGSLIYFNLLPTKTVEHLPEYPWWQTFSPLGEESFWANEDLRLSSRSVGKKKTTISILLLGGLEVASFVIDGMECDDEESLDAALSLRKRLNIRQQIRIESRMDHHTIVWYVPSKVNKEVRYG